MTAVEVIVQKEVQAEAHINNIVQLGDGGECLLLSIVDGGFPNSSYEELNITFDGGIE